MMEDSPKHVPGAPTRFITSLMPPRSSSAILLARACRPPSATSSRVAMAAAAHTGLELKVPFWATRSARSHTGSPRWAMVDMSAFFPQTAAPGSPPATIFDEVITGFRYAPGGAQQYFGVTPGA